MEVHLHRRRGGARNRRSVSRNTSASRISTSRLAVITAGKHVADDRHWMETMDAKIDAPLVLRYESSL
jgi:hypothetical protein